MIKMNEHMRTTLQSMLDIEAEIRGSIAGFNIPQFVVDLPGGGGKRLAWSYKAYDRKTGIVRANWFSLSGEISKKQADKLHSLNSLRLL